MNTGRRADPLANTGLHRVGVGIDLVGHRPSR
jgi:hypothetical protein